jgi:endoglucanase
MALRTRALVICLLFALLAAAAVWPAASGATVAPRPVVKGKRLVDSRTGRTFIPRGVDWPSFEYACFYGYAYSDPHADLTTAKAMARWHINTVRVPLNQDCWLGDDGRPASDGATLTVAGYRAAVKRYVSAIEAAGMVPIVDLHWSGPNGTPADGQRAMPDDRSPAFWSSVAGYFKRDRSIMFDAFNEPYTRYESDNTLTFNLTWPCWAVGGQACAPGAPLQNENVSPFDGTRYTPTGMQSLVDAIRATGSRRPVLLAGIDYANDLRRWLASRPDDPAGQLVASFHNYQGQRCDHVSCWNAEIAPVARHVPVITGEFGEDDCKPTYDNAYMKWADAHGVGYLAWAWVLEVKACSAYSVISNVNGTPRAPNGTALKAHLAALARR